MPFAGEKQMKILIKKGKMKKTIAEQTARNGAIRKTLYAHCLIIIYTFTTTHPAID